MAEEERLDRMLGEDAVILLEAPTRVCYLVNAEAGLRAGTRCRNYAPL